jgi:hypothetical protein
VFCGRHLLAAKLRRSNIDASAGAVEEVARIVDQIRARWSRVEILLRADSGFARDALMVWCEANAVDYLFGLARNRRLVGAVAEDLAAAAAESLARSGPARRFADLTWRTLDSWSRARRVVAKAEHLPKGANPRFVVTSLPASQIDARTLYEDVYCARGEVEKRIKEQLGRRVGAPFPSRRPSHLFADRTSAATMRAKPAQAVVRVLRLRAARGAPPHRLAPHTVRDRNLRHHPAQALEDRRPGAQERAPDQGRHGLSVPLPGRVPPRLSLSAPPCLLTGNSDFPRPAEDPSAPRVLDRQPARKSASPPSAIAKRRSGASRPAQLPPQTAPIRPASWE